MHDRTFHNQAITRIALIGFLFYLNLLSEQCYAQPFHWNGKKAAVVITYDDGYHEHLDIAIPVLDSLNLKATFYLSAAYPAVEGRHQDWQRVAQNGHELGNHTLYHPCVGGPGREWVRPEYDLSKYTVRRIEDEIRITNTLLELIDGKKERTYAYTCGEMKVGDSLYFDGLKQDFVAARGVQNRLESLGDIDLYNMDCYVVDNHTASQMSAWVDQAIETNSLLIVLFHGIGNWTSLNVEIKEHSTFLHDLKSKESDLWIAPLIDVANFIKEKEGN